MRRMYDAVTLTNCPRDGDLYAGYVDGRYKNFDQLAGLFPGKVHVGIAVFPSTNDGVVLDVEQGDAQPSQAPGWVSLRRAHGVDPTVYCSSSVLPTVMHEFDMQSVAQPHYWVAHYDNSPVIPPGCVAKQYADPGPYDISIVVDYWPGVDTALPPSHVIGTGTTGDTLNFTDISVTTDGKGDGWVDLPGVDPKKIVGIVPFIPFAYPNGYEEPGEWAVATGSQGEAVAQVAGAKISYQVTARVWTVS